VAESTGEILLALLRLVVGGAIVAALYLAWRGGALRRPKTAVRQRGRRWDWLWLAGSVVVVLLAMFVVKGELSETSNERAILLAFLIVMISAAALGFLVGVVIAVRSRFRKH